MNDDEVLAAALAAQPITPEEGERMRRISRAKVLRRRLGLTPLDFSKSFGIPIATLRDWEQRRCEPEGAALSLVRAIERDPETLLRLLRVVA